MLNFGLFLLTALLAGGKASAAGVTGAAEGFAKGVTGGGSASPVYPSTNAELVSCKNKPPPIAFGRLILLELSAIREYDN